MSTSPAWHWPALLMLPVIMTVAVPDWMYSQTDYIDAWVYHGFFRHLETYATTMFPQTYYGTRLGWIVPGYIAYHLFEPLVATVILHLVFYGIAVCSLYLIGRSVAGPSNALFVTCAFGLYVPVVRALGSDYVDGAVITYALLAVALGIHGLEVSRAWLIVASGAAAGAMLNSNVGAVFMVPSILVWLLPRWGDARLWRSLFGLACFWCAGIVLCTTALSLFSLMTGGDWDFFMISFRWMRGQGWANPWDVPGLSWIASAPWVFLPVATVVGALVILLIPQRRAQLTSRQFRALAALGLCFAVFVAWDFVGSGALLYWPFYASWLVPWSFIAVSAVLAPAPAHSRVDLAMLSASVCALVLSLVWPRQALLPVAGFVGLGVTIALLALAALGRTALASRLLVTAALVCVHGWLSTTNVYVPTVDRADAFRAIDRGVGIIEQYVTRDQPRFLLVPTQKLAHYVQGLTSVYLWGYTIASDSYPKVTPEQAARVVPGATVVVIAEQPDAAASFDEVLAPFGLSGEVRGAERVETRHGPLYLTFIEARARGAGQERRPAS